jgi:phenylalanyl-tRNA synthetase beta chain
MKLSLRWLGRWVDLSGLEPERIKNDLTMSTAEIEGVAPFGGGLEPVVVGKVVECRRHPDAEKLTWTRVDVGHQAPVSIVCGAPNVTEGQRVAVVLPGSALPDGTRIEKRTLRGVESSGMICSERELGLFDAHEGILVLDGEPQPGSPLLDAIGGALPDYVFEIDNKSINHRPDLWGHRGFARELAAIYGRKLRAEPRVELAVGSTEGQGRRSDARRRGGADVALAVGPITVQAREACPRYLALCLEQVQSKPSPLWLRLLLAAAGLRPIHQLVDLTNFVMADLGQPMHAFDLRHVAAGIDVRFAKEGEGLTTLDGVERRLTSKDLLISSGGRPLALAGVLGGQGSAIGADTTSILLESANFHAATIRRTSARHAVRTDSSTRFEKALDPSLAESAVHRFVELLRELQPSCRVAGPLADPTAWQFAPRSIRLRQERLDSKLGVALPQERVASILKSLEFDVRPVAGGFDVQVPSFRATKDVTIEDDLVEEVGRMWRYDEIPERPLVGAVAVPPREPELFLARELVKLAATEAGCHEVYNYTFVPDAVLAAVGSLEHPHARVRNPVAPDVTRIRRNVLPSTLASAVRNLRLLPEVRLVERGKGYLPERKGEHGLPHELHEIAFVWAILDPDPERGNDPYLSLRGHVLSLLSRTGHPCAADSSHSDERTPWTSPSRTVALARAGRTCGYVGMLHPAVAGRLGLPDATAIATVELRALLASGRDESKFAPIPRFPEQPVDVAVLAPEALRVADVAAALRAAGGGLARRVELFEVYRGKGLPHGNKSLNFTVALGADDRTLTADDEARFLAAARARVHEIGGEVRG